ncbi:cell elongation-specific peptidoglycan D,D-transpeptidase [Oceanobacillus limi]|uniref:serine-type D-Ala-D-Ala carboxypeptidase n=1 Tax=Oceanobacillus limi TaxID=930131 RepID=A0A1H9ZQE1_9BACI|nr:penicillin-binding protein 2 [Oceanobacillus limi]SES83889.1 cell elongation-specific peptidoglycan D,D-transpeptidase [Oceanobacillus limi]
MKKNKKKRAQLPFRLNIIFFVVFLLFSVLILQLGVVQILNGESFQEEIDQTIQDTTNVPVPRGKMYDRYQNVIADNEASYAITYTPAKGVQAEDRLELAEDLSKYISMLESCEGIQESDELEDCKDVREKQINSITERNKKEYWYLKNREEADSRLSIEEAADMSNAEAYNEILDRITEEEISGFTEEQQEVILIKKELDKAYSLTPQIVKNENVTPEEYARVAEHLHELPGINASVDWNREYPYGETFQNLIGRITTQDQGIPAENATYYLTRNYNRNDRVGKSGLEEQYEELLRGRKEQIQYTTNKKGEVIDVDTVVEGERGKDLVLTIDMELQKEVDIILQEEIAAARKENPYQNQYMTDAIAVVINPKTGELLAVAGQEYDKQDNEFINAPYKALYDAHRPGSVVKGATILSGFESGVINPGQYFHDSPIKIAGDEPKGSWTNGLGTLDDRGALRRSSNVYMFYIALRMGGEYRYPFPNGQRASFDTDAWQEMRGYFSQFGLGAETGVDYTYENTGYKGDSALNAGLFMNYAIGQYDTYTVMQLAQYVSTIANDGYRVRPHFLKEVRMPSAEEGQLGSVHKVVNTEILNRVDMEQNQIERVQEGFRQVMQESGGTGYSYFGDKKYKPAGKTGTAENEVYEQNEDGSWEKVADTVNLSLIGYAPHDEPEVAFALIVPDTREGNGINHKIGTRILDTYFELKEKRERGNMDTDNEEEVDNEEE